MFKRTEKYTLVGTPASLIQQLDRVQKQDKRAERNRSSSCGLGCLGMLFTFLGLPALLPHDLTAQAMWLGIGGSIATSWFGYYYWNARDLDDTKLAVARHLLELLQVDVRDNVQTHLTLDFRNFLSGVTKTEGLKKHYRQTWLELSTVLADSTRCELQVTRQGRYREKVKRRTANKVRHVRADRISVSLRVDPARYPDLSGVVLGVPPMHMNSRGVRAGQNRLTAILTTRTATYDNVRNLADHPEWLAAAPHILGALAWAYRGMKAVKTASVKG